MEKYHWLNKHSRQFLERDYLEEGVTPEQRVRQIAENAEKILALDGFADKFEHYVALGFYSLSTPVWTNFGNERGLPVSCFGAYCPDTMEGILTKLGEIGTQSKLGGGTSAYFGDLRPRGSKISVGGESSGPVHFMELFDAIADVISQGSTRRGSFAAYLPVEHPDILEFLQIRDEGHSIQNMSIGVTITDKWMKEMTEGDKDKRKIWGRIIKKRFESGYPYIQFTDTVNNNAPQVYKDKGMKIKASNLCVAPETQILTSLGYFAISDLEGQKVSVWNGQEFSDTVVFKTGEQKSLTKVEFSDGTEIYATPEHKWYITKDYKDQRKGILTEKRTNELNIGDRLCKFELPTISEGTTMLEPYTHGAYCADGFDSGEIKQIALYGDKVKIIPYLSLSRPVRKYCAKTDRTGVIINQQIKEKFYVPVDENLNDKLRWLEGFMDCEGHVAMNGNNQSLQAGSIHKEFLKNIQLMLQTIGVFSKITDSSEEGFRMMPDGRGGQKEYFCQKSYRLLVNSSGLIKLKSLGFSPKKLILNDHVPQRDATVFVQVKAITENSRIDDTYCCNEPLEHKIVLNGHLTGNCSEIELSSDENNSFVCVLSSLNLLHWDEIVETDAIETLIYFLDAVNQEFINKTENMKFMEAPHNFAKNQRALGAGVLGWHSLLQSKMISFESMEAKFLNSSIWQTIRERADKATQELANILGEPELLKGYGRRNVTTLAVAPTTSSSFILGQVSPSIEPQNSNYYVKKLAKGSFTYRNPFLKNLLKTYGKNDDETWKSILVRGGSVQHLDFLTENDKSVFKTFGEISQREIAIQAGQRQRHLDQSQSLNFMIPPNTKPKEVSDLLIDCWHMGVKTCYYQRSANPSQELARSIMTCSSCEG